MVPIPAFVMSIVEGNPMANRTTGRGASGWAARHCDRATAGGDDESRREAENERMTVSRRTVTAPLESAPVATVVEKYGSASASANALALSNRSAGSFSSACATAAATFGGTFFRSFVTGAASSVTIFMMICCAELPTCGGFPVSIS